MLYGCNVLVLWMQSVYNVPLSSNRGRANFNRVYWIEVYKEIMREKELI